jgi:tripartite ATP-independent transporter DctM subunit
MSFGAYLVITLFLILMVLRVPIAFSMAISAVTYLFVMGMPLDIVALRMTYALDSFPLLAVPAFMLAGNLMNGSGITDRIYMFAQALVGRLPGGLAHVNIIGSLIFSGMSGSALADVGGLGTMEIKAMTDAGYRRDFSAAVTVASATIGPIFPPSIPFIIYAAVTETSALELLIAGIFPALILTLLLMAAVAVLAKVRHFPRYTESASLKRLWKTFVRTVPALLTPVLLIGGMVSGIFSPTEAAAVTVAYALLLGGVVYRDLTLRALYDIVKQTMLSISVIMFMIAAAVLFGWVITIEQIPQAATQGLLNLTRDPVILLLLANVLLLIVGCFLDTIAGILLFAPLVAGALSEVGVDPIHIGVVVILNLMIGLITPPVGMSLYLVSNVSGEPVENVLRETIPFFVPLLLCLALVTYVPWLSTFLPSLIR